MREKRDKLRLDHDTHSPDPTHDAPKKSKHKQKFEHRQSNPLDALAVTETKAQPIGTTPMGGVGGISEALNQFRADGLHNTAEAIRMATPDETPDRNVAVSLTKETMESMATFATSAATPSPKPKPKSKLRYDKQRLKFEQDTQAAQSGESNNASEHGGTVDSSDVSHADTAEQGERHDGSVDNSEANKKQTAPQTEQSDNPTDTTDTPNNQSGEK